MSERLRFFYSPVAAAKSWFAKKHPEAKKEEVTPGLLADLHLAVNLADAAEQFLKTKYHGVLVDFLEMRAQKLYEDFEKGTFERETYFKAAALLKDVSEYPFRLIRSGQVAADKLREWDQQGQTKQVADADAYRLQGETDARPV